jgi:hypothetical protein
MKHLTVVAAVFAAAACSANESTPIAADTAKPAMKPAAAPADSTRPDTTAMGGGNKDSSGRLSGLPPAERVANPHLRSHSRTPS